MVLLAVSVCRTWLSTSPDNVLENRGTRLPLGVPTLSHCERLMSHFESAWGVFPTRYLP